MKRSLLALAFLVVATPVFAACPATLQLKDNAGATPTAKYTDDGSGNCMANIAVQDGADATQGAKADAVASTDTGTFSLMALIKRLNQSITALIAAVQASIPAGGNVIGFTSNDPCTQAIKTNIPVSMTGTTTVKLLALSGGKKIYICSINLRASAATVWSIADGTKVTTECDTTPEAIIGATTATHGLSEAANGGNAQGSGSGTIALTNTASHDLCLFQSGAGDLSGNLTVVQQ